MVGAGEVDELVHQVAGADEWIAWVRKSDQAARHIVWHVSQKQFAINQERQREFLVHDNSPLWGLVVVELVPDSFRVYWCNVCQYDVVEKLFDKRQAFFGLCNSCEFKNVRHRLFIQFFWADKDHIEKQIRVQEFL